MRTYAALVREALATRVGEVREARADVLAAQQVREVALTELDLARRNTARREAEEWGRTQAEYERELRAAAGEEEAR